jgi:3-methyladenine DNA glycosylase AlkD
VKESKPTSPAAAARHSLKALERAGDPRRAAGAAAYFRSYERVAFFGVDMPTVRRMASDLRRNGGREWSVAQAIEFTDRMIARRELEAIALGTALLGRFRRVFDRRLLRHGKRWLAQSCRDWASTDGLCGDVLGPLLAAHPELVARVRPWRASRELYVRRASVVALIGLARRGAALDEVYGAALALAGDDHHLMHKAVGWLLREAGKTDPDRLERFLRTHGRKLSRTSVRYAIERFPPARRRGLLIATRTPARPAPGRARGV